MTFVYRSIFPFFMIGALGFFTLIAFVRPEFIEGDDIETARWWFLAGTLAVAFLSYRYLMPIKRVAIDGDSLVVDDFKREIVVPLRNVEKVSGSILVTPELAFIEFRRPTEFGTKVIFMPRWRFFGGFTQHPIVSELRSLAERAAHV